MATKVPGVVRFAAVGDLLLTPPPKAVPYRRDPALISPAARSLVAQCDVAFANLECTLPGDGSCIPTEPLLIATAELVRSVKTAGFRLVTLANNHVLDCLDGGFRNLRCLLDELGMRYFGAGWNLDEAAAPAILEVNGVRLAFLGAVDPQTGPYRFASPDGSGVPALDVARLARQVRDLRCSVDHVLISLHWGEERFSVPSPAQVEQAHRLVDAGASMILGHHPHVLQGLEIYRRAPIIYSLGNFVADNVHFSDGDAIRWNRVQRTGCILLAEISKAKIENVRQVPTHDSGRLVDVDASRFGRRRIEQTRRAIAGGVSIARYRRERLWVKTIRPFFGHLRWSKLKRLRWRQICNTFRGFLQSK